MKTLLLLVSLTACASELDDVPPMPMLSLFSGELENGTPHRLRPGDRVVSGAAIAINASWYGICYERDIVRDEDVGYPCEEQAFQLTTSCAGAGCPAPATMSSADGKARLELVPTVLGPISLLSSMIHLTTQQTPTALLDMDVVAPDAIVVRGFDRSSPSSPRPLSSIVSNNPLLRLDAQLRVGAADVAFASSQLTVNGHPATIESLRAVFDLRLAFPAAIEPNGGLRPGAYVLDIALAGKTLRSTIDVLP